MEKEDFFLLLRYFKIELNGEQLRRLERIFNCRLETDSAGCFMSACSLKPGDMSIFPTQQSSIVDEEDEEQAVENIVIDEDEDGDGSGTTEDMQILKPDQRTQPIAAKIAKKVLETRIEPLRRSEASTSTGEWLGKPETMPRFQEIGIQCDNPCTIQLPLSNPNVTTRPVTRSQANKTSKSTSQLTTPTISKCTIVRTTNFCYPSLMSTRATKCVPTSRKLQVDEENSAVKTRAQKKVSRGLAKLVSPTFSLDSSNASSVILPANPFQFIQTTRLKKRLLANMCNVVDQGAGAVNQLMDGVPQKRKENLLLAQKQLEWILRDDFCEQAR
uniref:Uncharacterized protein n=1 Tax=Ditylenchus dipsaci TaxID=166011 RepID=A0A915E946_9BILA